MGKSKVGKMVEKLDISTTIIFSDHCICCETVGSKLNIFNKKSRNNNQRNSTRKQRYTVKYLMRDNESNLQIILREPRIISSTISA